MAGAIPPPDQQKNGSTAKTGSNVTLQTQHRYDEFGRLNGQSWAMGGKAYQEAYSYNNNNGNLTGKQITLPNTSTADITLGYDGLSRLSSVTSPVSSIIYNYADAFYGGGTTRQVSQMSVNPVSTNSNVFTRLFFRYNYDALGNITKIEDFGAGSTIANRTQYTYDKQSQLTSATSTLHGTWTYEYDTYGNIRSKVHGADTTSFTYSDSNWRDLLKAVSGTKGGTSFSGSYTYDGAGNPLSYYNVGDLSTWTMTWQNGRELATAGNGTNSVSYDYDVSGLRTYKTVNGVRHDYTYASGLLLRETYTKDGTAYTLDFVYDQANRPYILNLTTTTGSTTHTTVYYYLLNLQGDVVKLVDASGVVVASYDYDSYGNILTSTGNLATINPLRYRGYYYDDETGFYYLQSRYYDPQIGRFINADSYASTGQGFLGYNMFAYCANRPTDMTDSTGCIPVESTGQADRLMSKPQKPVRTAKEQQPAWQVLGFGFNGSGGEFHSLEAGKAPTSYTQWLEQGGKLHSNIVLSSYSNATTYISEITLVPHDQILTYIDDEYGDSYCAVGWGVASAGLGAAVSKFVPGVSVVSAAYSSFELLYVRPRNVSEKTRLREIYDEGNHALFVTISCNYPGPSATAVYSFDGSNWIFP